MKFKELPTKEYLDECLDYNPDTGVFLWKKRPLHHFKTVRGMNRSNSQFSGKLAGHVKISEYHIPYLIIRINNSDYAAHRLAVVIMGDKISRNDVVDHKDGNGLNNIYSNIRTCDHVANNQNSSIRSDNKSGFTGVSFDSESGKWNAQINVSGKRIRLGRFRILDDAIKARKAANKKYGFHENHGREVNHV